MPYRICKVIEVESGHMLSKHPENCKFPHGHSRRVEVVLEADELDANDMVCDFAVVKLAVRDFVRQYDHAMCVNTSDPQYADFKRMYGERVIGFDDVDPTTEVMVKTMFEAIRAKLANYAAAAPPRYPLSSRVRLRKVRAWETSTAWAEYAEE